MAAAESAVVDSRPKREDHKQTKHDPWFSKWKPLIGPGDWEGYSEGKEGVPRYSVENLPTNLSPGIYELAIYPTGSSSTGKLDPKKALPVYVGKADCVRTRIQVYGRTGSHLCRRSDGETGCPRFEEIFSRGCSILYRWVATENKTEASIIEAQLLKTYDYAWNKGSNGPLRHDDILRKLDKGARKGVPGQIVLQDDEFSKIVNREKFNILSQVFKFGRSQPRLVLDRGGSNENETITCRVTLGDGSICRRIPSIVREPSLISENCPTLIEDSGPVCGVAMDDGSVCTRQPVSGRKRCDVHKGMKKCNPNVGTTYEPFEYSIDPSGFDKKSEIHIRGKVETGPHRPVNKGCNTICGVELRNGHFCTNQPVSGRVRCEEHKGLRVNSLQSGSDAKGTSHVSDAKSILSSYDWNHCRTSVPTCGALTRDGSSCQRTVNGKGRCWQHSNHDSGSSSNSLLTPRYSDCSGRSASICGALTGGGSSCQRTVNGNGRCWQHSNHDSGSSSNSFLTPRYSDYGCSGRSTASSICGAPTRSGSYCQRRVNGNGRCWQH